jgi:hypothetical protein
MPAQCQNRLRLVLPAFQVPLKMLNALCFTRMHHTPQLRLPHRQPSPFQRTEKPWNFVVTVLTKGIYIAFER